MNHQYKLAEYQTQVGSDHVQTEHHPTLLGISLLVEPAFDDHVLAHHAQTDDHPQQQPYRQPVRQAVAQYCCPDDTGAGGIGPDMTDTGNQPVTDLAAQHQTKIVGRHQCADPQAVDIVGSQAQGKIGAQKPRADQHHQRSKIQGAKRLPDLVHGVPCSSVCGPPAILR